MKFGHDVISKFEKAWLNVISIGGLKFHFRSLSRFCLPFLTCRRILTPLQQTTFENTATKGEIAHNEQFPLLPQCFQRYSILQLSFKQIFSYFRPDFFKVVCCRFVVCGKEFSLFKHFNKIRFNMKRFLKSTCRFFFKELSHDPGTFFCNNFIYVYIALK